MKIAVTYKDGEVFQHFGHSEAFKVYTIEDGQVVSGEVMSTNGNGHGALAGILQGEKIEALICGGIGGGARNALAAANIKLYPGVTGNADAAAQALAEGSLDFDPDKTCNHHGSDHVCESGSNHSCAHH